MNLETVASFPTLLEAHMAKNMLENRGIPCELLDTGTIAANPFLSIALGGVRLQVRAENAAIARRLLEGLEPEE